VTKGVAAIQAATYAADIKVWEFEDASKTIAYGGTASHIFSGKRQNWDTYVLGSLSDSVDSHVEVHGDDAVSDTTSAIADLTAQVLALQALQNVYANASEASLSSSSTDMSKQAYSVGVAALVITLIYAVGMTLLVKDLHHKVSVLERVGASTNNYEYNENSSQKSLVITSGAL